MWNVTPSFCKLEVPDIFLQQKTEQFGIFHEQCSLAELDSFWPRGSSATSFIKRSCPCGQVRVLPILLLSVLALGSGNTLQGTIDLARLQAILQDNINSNDVSTLYYAVKGLKQLNAKIPDVCNQIKNAKYDTSNIELVFHHTTAAALSGCQNSLTPGVLAAASQTLDKKDASIADLYHAVYSLKALGKGSVYDKEDGLKNLVALLKKDDSPANYAYVFGLCEHMGCAAWTVSHADGTLLAADESDGKALHFEGGLPVTSAMLASVYRTFKSLKKPSPLTEVQRNKFAEYLLSRRSVTTAKGAACLIEGALAIADDEPTPVAIAVKGKRHITAEADSIEVSITDLVGRAYRNLKPEEVIAQSGTRLADDVVVLSKQALTKKHNEPTTFVLNLGKIKSQYGVYKIAISAASKTSNIVVAVLGEIQVPSVEVGVGDVDGTTSPKTTTVTWPNKLPETIHVDHLQKVSVKFTVRDKANKPVLVQQAFVHVGGEAHEAVFVAETDNSKAYKVELNVATVAKHLGPSSAAKLSLFVGDSAVAAPVQWPLGDIIFNFGKQVGAVASPSKPVRAALPEIHHQFRVPEARPPAAVSTVFSCAAAAPLLLLLILWARIGINFGNLPLTSLPSVLAFHAGLGGALSLYGFLWLELTMFDTLRYLLPLGLLTFLAGHRVLRRLVSDKMAR